MHIFCGQSVSPPRPAGLRATCTCMQVGKFWTVQNRYQKGCSAKKIYNNIRLSSLHNSHSHYKEGIQTNLISCKGVDCPQKRYRNIDYPGSFGHTAHAGMLDTSKIVHTQMYLKELSFVNVFCHKTASLSINIALRDHLAMASLSIEHAWSPNRPSGCGQWGGGTLSATQ